MELSTLSELTIQYVEKMNEKKSIISIIQGEIIGELNPFDMPEMKILSLDTDSGAEHRVLISRKIFEEINQIKKEIELVQCIGFYDATKQLTVALDVIVLTKTKEIVFKE